MDCSLWSLTWFVSTTTSVPTPAPLLSADMPQTTNKTLWLYSETRTCCTLSQHIHSYTHDTHHSTGHFTHESELAGCPTDDNGWHYQTLFSVLTVLPVQKNCKKPAVIPKSSLSKKSKGNPLTKVRPENCHSSVCVCMYVWA